MEWETGEVDTTKGPGPVAPYAVARSHGWPLEMEASPGLQVETGGKLTAAQLAGQGGPHLHVGAEGLLLF